MTKRILALLFAAVMLLSLAACKQNDTPAITKPTEPTEPTAKPTVPETAQIISQVRWLVDFNAEELACRYDEKSNTLNITGEGFYPVEILFFEGAKQVQKQTVRDDEGQIYTQQEYDEQGNLIYQQDDYGFRRFYEYDGKLLIRETAYQEGDQPYSVKTWTYDDAGREIYYTEEADGGDVSEQISQTYDEAGNLIEYRLDSYYADSHWYQIDTYTYDSGRLAESTHEGDDPANSWDYTVTYRYDEQGRKVGALRTEEFCGEAEDIWVYNDNGQLIRSAEYYQMDGWVETLNEYSYDDAGRLVREYYKESYLSDGELFFWDETLYTYDSEGHLTEQRFISMDETEYVNRYEYDEQGNKTQHSYLIDGEEEYLLTYTYDTADKLIRIDLNSEEILSGENILFLSGEDVSDRYIAAQYENTADAAEAAAVNEFILQYIQDNY